jgi:uncharacterized protein (TIGR04222 family)
MLIVAIYLIIKNINPYDKNFKTIDLNYLELAYLSYGIKGAYIVSFIHLWKNDSIILQSNSQYLIIKTHKSDLTRLNKFEQSLIKFFSKPKIYESLYKNKTKQSAENLLGELKSKLIEDNLLISNKNKFTIWICFLFGILLSFSIPLVQYNFDKYQIFGLPILISFISAIAMYIVSAPFNLTTFKAQQILKEYHEKYKWLKESNNTLTNIKNTLYGSAVFGAEAVSNDRIEYLLDNPKIGGKYQHTDSGLF